MLQPDLEVRMFDELLTDIRDEEGSLYWALEKELSHLLCSERSFENYIKLATIQEWLEMMSDEEMSDRESLLLWSELIIGSYFKTS